MGLKEKGRGASRVFLLACHRRQQLAGVRQLCNTDNDQRNADVEAAGMAKLADAADLKSAGPKGLWGFDSPSRHHPTRSENG
jgi:hypothetical protein